MLEHARHRLLSATPATPVVVSERAPAARLANVCPSLERVVFPNEVQWRRPSPSLPRSRSSRPPFDDFFVTKIAHDVAPPPPPRKVVPLTEQRFMKAEQRFDFNDSDDDDDSPFFKLSATRQRSSMQRCHEQANVGVHGAVKIVMARV